MGLFLRIDINIVAIIVLTGVTLIADRRLDKQNPLNKAFLRVSLIILLQLIFETSTCIINRCPNTGLMYLSNILHVCLFVTGPILAYYGYVMIESIVVPDQVISKREHIMLCIPILLNTLLTILSPIGHFIFYIDNTNVYRRGNYFLLFAGITYAYIFLNFISIIKNKKRIMEQEFTPLIMFAIMPMVGGIVQTIFYGALLMWSSTAFSLIAVYIILQQRMVQIDELTGTWTRGSFDFYITSRLNQKNNEKIGIIYCDIDGLKGINDTYGHIEGDYAIKTATAIMKKVIHKNDIMVRMGGDEFIILVECENTAILQEILKSIDQSFIQYNKKSKKPYKLSCSFGADLLNKEYKSIEQFLHHVDSLMYDNKKAKKDLVPFIG